MHHNYTSYIKLILGREQQPQYDQGCIQKFMEIGAWKKVGGGGGGGGRPTKYHVAVPLTGREGYEIDVIIRLLLHVCN